MMFVDGEAAAAAGLCWLLILLLLTQGTELGPVLLP